MRTLKVIFGLVALLGLAGHLNAQRHHWFYGDDPVRCDPCYLVKGTETEVEFELRTPLETSFRIEISVEGDAANATIGETGTTNGTRLRVGLSAQAAGAVYLSCRVLQESGESEELVAQYPVVLSAFDSSEHFPAFSANDYRAILIVAGGEALNINGSLLNAVPTGSPVLRGCFSNEGDVIASNATIHSQELTELGENAYSWAGSVSTLSHGGHWMSVQATLRNGQSDRVYGVMNFLNGAPVGKAIPNYVLNEEEATIQIAYGNITFEETPEIRVVGGAATIHSSSLEATAIRVTLTPTTMPVTLEVDNNQGSPAFQVLIEASDSTKETYKDFLKEYLKDRFRKKVGSECSVEPNGNIDSAEFIEAVLNGAPVGETIQEVTNTDGSKYRVAIKVGANGAKGADGTGTPYNGAAGGPGEVGGPGLPGGTGSPGSSPSGTGGVGGPGNAGKSGDKGKKGDNGSDGKPGQIGKMPKAMEYEVDPVQGISLIVVRGGKGGTGGTGVNGGNGGAGGAGGKGGKGGQGGEGGAGPSDGPGGNGGQGGTGGPGGNGGSAGDGGFGGEGGDGGNGGNGQDVRVVAVRGLVFIETGEGGNGGSGGIGGNGGAKGTVPGLGGDAGDAGDGGPGGAGIPNGNPGAPGANGGGITSGSTGSSPGGPGGAGNGGDGGKAGNPGKHLGDTKNTCGNYRIVKGSEGNPGPNGDDGKPGT